MNADAPTELVRHCLQPGADGVALDAWRRALAAWGPAEWAAVGALVEGERVGPLLHRARAAAALLPPALQAANRQAYRVSALRNRLLMHELQACLRACAAAQVDVIVLKGAALAERLYGDLALRPMVDLDLLVRPDQRAAAERVLRERGYAPLRSEVYPGALAVQENELELARPGRLPLHLDLHWTLFDSPHHQHRVEPAWLWDTADAAVIAGVPARVLGPEAQLLHLCGHLMLHHAGRGLLWWRDIAAFLPRVAARIDWEALLARARRYDLQLPLARVLSELAGEWNVAIPDATLAALRALRPSPQEEWLFARLSAPQRSAGGRFWTDLVSTPGLRARWRFARAQLFPSAAYMRGRYGIRYPLLLPLYYPYRWWRGVAGR